MSRKIELLAPGGDVEAIKAAIVAGANAVYCGLDTFNARNRATNLSYDDLVGVIGLAHEYFCEVFLTLNVVILEHEMPTLINLLNKLVNSGLDGIIVQDLGVFNLVNKHFPTLDIHASTQMTTHNEGQIKFLKKIGATRVNLSRELNLGEIKSLTALAHEQDVLTEVFVHGALCIAFSGQCYSSSVSVGNSGNRGRCSQACRDEYEITDAGNKYPLNLKDNSAYYDLPELVDAKVDSLKIEGRIKGAHYVYTVVDTWRKQINSFVEKGELIEDDSNLHKVFNRSFTNSFLTGNLNKEMFIDSPRDYSVKNAVEQSDAISIVQIHDAKQELYSDRNELGATLKQKIEFLNIDKKSLHIEVSGKKGASLQVKVTVNSTQQNNESEIQSFQVDSSSILEVADEVGLNAEIVEKRIKGFDKAKYDAPTYDFKNLDDGLAIPFKELTLIKEQIKFLLNDSQQVVKHVEVPSLLQHDKIEKQPKLSLLIADVKDLSLCDVTDVDIYFKLPESFKKGCDKFINIFKENPRLIPWFPAVLIGKDYIEAVRVLEEVKPARIVSNNTGVAFRAYELGIEWVAGPFMNTTNSHALVTLQEELNCSGAFISNEINRGQIKNIKRPDGFKLLYSIYHPILMMTSRQCFFQRTVGCKKPTIEDGCMLKCKKATTITNVKGISFAVDKQRGGYPSIYNDEQFLNFNVIEDFSDLFDEFFIDLTDIGSGSKAELDKKQLIYHFENLLKGEAASQVQLSQMVTVSTDAQYKQGL